MAHLPDNDRPLLCFIYVPVVAKIECGKNYDSNREREREREREVK